MRKGVVWAEGARERSSPLSGSHFSEVSMTESRKEKGRLLALIFINTGSIFREDAFDFWVCEAGVSMRLRGHVENARFGRTPCG
jgi:hypothetical protein